MVSGCDMFAFSKYSLKFPEVLLYQPQQQLEEQCNNINNRLVIPESNYSLECLKDFILFINYKGEGPSTGFWDFDFNIYLESYKDLFPI
ncbi:expressed protein [Dictyostelium purpureum]|uniref:Expressed protein n=1 Tax=Dictyostelium purpureum TaxID=5786 RepID=F0ZGZ6_DICPU|nr:uncharacterized protein DICPUDRAFT_91771 [Dictyostelium purpureum]EGC36819.1 expressed protein [Dictyostelium purpureum]|eukprot:XP_003286690.1 expressed protein [Dictyostelium purpureum]